MCPKYSAYSADSEELLKTYVCEEDSTRRSILRKIDHIRLLYDKITNTFDIEGMEKWMFLKTCFPLHSQEALSKLADTQGFAELSNFSIAED